MQAITQSSGVAGLRVKTDNPVREQRKVMQGASSQLKGHQMKRNVTADELMKVKMLLQEKLREKASVLIPMDRLTPLLVETPSSRNRIIWTRVFRRFFADIGIRCSVRNRKEVYIFSVVDPERWANANGLSQGHQSSDRTGPKPPSNETDFPDPLIPSCDPEFFVPAWAEDLLKSIEANERCFLVGPTGCGKSSVIRELAARKGARFMRVNLNGETSVADLIGQWRVKGKEMIYQEGPVPKAMRLGAWLCLDELDSAIPQVLFCIQALAEEEGKLFIPEIGEWIAPHPSFRLCASANTLGRGDDSGLYSGTSTLNEAFLDRFGNVYLCSYLPAPEEKKLLLTKNKGLEAATAQRMVQCANEIRAAIKTGVLYCTFSTRRLLAWGRKTVQIGNAKHAAIITILNRLGEDDSRPVSEVLQRHGF